MRAVWAIAAAVLSLAGCERFEGGSTTRTPQPTLPDMSAIEAVPLGDLAGAAHSTLATQFPNPYEGDPQAVQQGLELFMKMNCAGCHGYGAPGGMGPNLKDGYWRYGGTPVAVFKSIYEGRPQGMPAWNPALPPQEIWKIVAYIESLGGTYKTGQFQASVQGDRAGERVAPETTPTLPSHEASASQPSGADTAPAAAPPNPDEPPPAGSTR